MPNHITNRMTVIQGQYDLSKITTFNTVSPMPRALKDTEHNSIAMDVERMLGTTRTFFGDRPTLPDLYDKYSEQNGDEVIAFLISNQITYGATSWLNWSIKNWGTKWDMYDVLCENNILSFDTAWSTPIKWVETFSKTLPDDVVIKLEYADEDIGSNAGIIEISNKSCIGNHFDNGSDDAWKLAIDLKDMGDLCKKIDGQWVYVDEDDQ